MPALRPLGPILRLWLPALLLPAVLILAPARSAAQSRPMPLAPPPVEEGNKKIWSVNVLFALPEDMVGAAVHYVPPKGTGGYGSLWIATNLISDDTYYYEGLDPETVEGLLGGHLESKASQWGGGRAGLTRRLSRELYVFGGLGLMRSHNYLRYGGARQPTADPGGRLWIDDPDRDTLRLVGEAGIVYYTEGGIGFVLGLGTPPAGVSIGMGFGTKP